MNMQNLGSSELLSTRLAYGCMRLPGVWDPAKVGPEQKARARTALRAAFEAGYNLFDHADIYCRGACEQLFGDLLRDTPSLRRADFLLATKMRHPLSRRSAGRSAPLRLLQGTHPVELRTVTQAAGGGVY